MVTEDMKELGIDLTMEEIAGTSKLRFKEIIKNKVETKALQYLTKLKESHSKAKNIKHDKIQLQPYLRSETKNLTINEKKFIFAARTRMLDVKGNFKTGMLDRKCRKCEATDETQQHLLDCPALSDSSLVLGTLERLNQNKPFIEYIYIIKYLFVRRNFPLKQTKELRQ